MLLHSVTRRAGPPGDGATASSGVGTSLTGTPLVLWVAAVVGLAVSLSFGCRLVVPFTVAGLSMSPTLADGDRILVRPYDPRRMAIRRGELVVAWVPPGKDRSVVKRVFACGGDAIATETAGPSRQHETATAHRSPMIRIPEHCYFLLGDDRERSKDSRDWGPVCDERILGRVLFRYWPINRVGPV